MKWLFLLLVVLGSVFLAGVLARLVVKPAVPEFGVSFSQKYAQELSIDWRHAYTELLKDLGFRRIRLMSYWDGGEPEPGHYRFDDLDWQFEMAAQAGAKISLAIGLRQPRWPECHQPPWAAQLPPSERDQALAKYIETVVTRYQHHPALASWQLENEALNRFWGKCEPPDRQRVIEEFQAVKKLDPSHPIIGSLSDQHGLPLWEPVPDIYGFSVYRTFYNRVGYHGYITYPTPAWYHRWRAGVVRLLHGKPIIIHELQAEPWGPRSIPEMSVEEQSKSMSMERLRENVAFAQRLSIAEIDLWGAEWWYWRKTKLNDPSLWETVREVTQQP